MNPIFFFIFGYHVVGTSYGSSIYDLKNGGNRTTLGAKAPGRNLVFGAISHFLAYR